MPEKNQNRGIEFESDSASKNKQGLSYLFGIGINKYLEFPNLNNAVKDIQDFESVLNEKYDLDRVISLFDADASRDNIIDGFDELKRKIGPTDKLIIYFSGHGHIEDEDSGFWIPSDAIQNRTSRYIRNSTIREYIKKIKSKHTLLISDACFSGSLLSGKERSAGQVVFEKLESKPSRWALCSGRHDEKVADGKPGGNSPFASSILEILKENQDSHLNVAKLADEVVKLTADEYDQLPEGSPVKGVGHRGGEYIFKRKEIAKKPTKSEKGVSEKEQATWEKSKAKDSIRLYTNYLIDFPNGHFRNEAKKRLQELEEETQWKKTNRAKKRVDYLEYLEQYPKGLHAEEAKAAIHHLNEKEDWEEANEKNEPEVYQEFLEDYPDGKYAAEAQQKIAVLDEKKAWENAQVLDNLESYQEFIKRFPEGKFLEKATIALEKLKEREDWEEAKEKNNITNYQKYLKAYPEGRFVKQAELNLQKLRDVQAWNKAKTQNTITAYNTYLKNFPEGKFLNNAQEAINQLKDEEAWDKAKNSTNLPTFEKYIKSFPEGKYIKLAQERVLELRDELEWNKALKSDKLLAYQSYLEDFPKGKHHQLASQKINEIEEHHAWSKIKKQNRISDYLVYLTNYPKGIYRAEAKQAIKLLEDKEAWNQAKKFKRVSAYEQYLKKFPKGQFREEAATAINTLKEEVIWEEALNQNTISAYRKYLNNYPKGKFVKESKRKQDQIRDEKAWKKAKSLNKVSAYKAYLNDFPKGNFRNDADANIQNIKAQQNDQIQDQHAWEKAKDFNTLRAYQNYLKEFPKGKYAEDAKKLEVKLKSPQIELGNNRNFSFDLLPKQVTEPIQDKDGNTYSTKLMKDGKIWMTQNLNLSIKGAFSSPNELSPKYIDRFYTLKAARKAAKIIGDGWRLPTEAEWRRLIALYGISSQSKIKKIFGGDKKHYRNLLRGGSSGFNATPTSSTIISDKLKSGSYWASGGEKVIFSIFADSIKPFSLLPEDGEEDIACLVRLIKINIPK